MKEKEFPSLLENKNITTEKEKEKRSWFKNIFRDPMNDIHDQWVEQQLDKIDWENWK